jgi:hypothetical protein
LRRTDKILVPLVLIFVGGAIFVAATMCSYALPVQDLAQYWAAAHLLPQNPYSMDLTSRFEQSAGIYSTPLITKMPPWALVTFLPLGLFGYHVSFALWAVASVVIVGWCTYAVGRNVYPGTSIAPAVLPFIFGPTFVLLMLGQYTVFVLLGVILFCLFIQHEREWLAGASLLFVVGKPHIAFLFLIAIACWIVYRRRWVVFLSGSITLAAACLLAVLINTQVFQQFRERSLLVVHERESYPNLGGILYSTFGLHWLALLPQALGMLWVIYYWTKNRAIWKWEYHGLVVLLVSVSCSYYSYPYDQILCLPALVVAFARGNRRAFLLAFAITNLGYLAYLSNVAGHFGYGYMFLWWTALGWLATFLLAQTNFLSTSKRVEQQ